MREQRDAVPSMQEVVQEQVRVLWLCFSMLPVALLDLYICEATMNSLVAYRCGPLMLI